MEWQARRSIQLEEQPRTITNVEASRAEKKEEIEMEGGDASETDYSEQGQMIKTSPPKYEDKKSFALK